MNSIAERQSGVIYCSFFLCTPRSKHACRPLLVSKMVEARISHVLDGRPGSLSKKSITEKRSGVGLGNGLGALIALGAGVSMWFVYRKNSSRSASNKTDLTNGMRGKIRTIHVDMKDEMRLEAINCALEAFERDAVPKDVALHVQFHFEKKYGGNWHCIAGSDFGCDFSSKAGHCIHFEVGGQGVVLFKV